MPESILRKRATRWPRVALLAAAGLASALVVAGCGGSTASTASRTTASAAGSEVTFSKCIRANGVPNFPDLRGNGMLIEGGGGQTVSINGVSVNAPAFETARQKCQKYLPHSHPSPAQTAQQRVRGLEFANCMRSHGVPNYPDPKVISRSSGNQTLYLPGINPRSPAFQAGAKACGGFGPKGP
jgi:hypothetical protein